MSAERELEALSRDEQVRLGHHAERLLGDEVLRMATEDAERRLLAEWKRCEDPDRRDAIWSHVQGIAEVLSAIRRIRDAGILAGK